MTRVANLGVIGLIIVAGAIATPVVVPKVSSGLGEGIAVTRERHTRILAGFNFQLTELPAGEAARLSGAGEVIGKTDAEQFARKEYLAAEAKLRGEPVLVHANVLAAYDTQQPFHGLAWALDFEAEVPFSGGGMPVDGSLTSPRETVSPEQTHLLILVDAETGALLAVAAVGLP